ncbi:MAG: DUF4349 domain-containing protein [Cyclobacteriaceae bacterium]|nr:DUF4349 domain-containing protein [Cyclobacteriaceae bacterium]
MFLFFFTFLFSLACHEANDSMNGDMEMEFDENVFAEVPATMQAANQQTAKVDAPSQKLIKTGFLEFQCPDIEKTYARIKVLLPDYGAYVESEDQSRGSSRISYVVDLRVPAASYDSLYRALTGLDVLFDSKRSSIEDVTDRYYDLASRIKNKKELENRYLELLQKAVLIKDMLEIEDKLNEIRTEIEQLEGQFTYLSHRVSHSSLHLVFYQVLPRSFEAPERLGFGLRVWNGINAGWQGFLTFVVGIARIWPFLLLIGMGYYVYRKARSARKKGE